jgi:hypothetical protein
MVSVGAQWPETPAGGKPASAAAAAAEDPLLLLLACLPRLLASTVCDTYARTHYPGLFSLAIPKVFPRSLGCSLHQPLALANSTFTQGRHSCGCMTVLWPASAGMTQRSLTSYHVRCDPVQIPKLNS